MREFNVKKLAAWSILAVAYLAFLTWCIWAWHCVLASWDFPDIGEADWSVRWGFVRASAHIGVILSISHSVWLLGWALRNREGPWELERPTTF